MLSCLNNAVGNRANRVPGDPFRDTEFDVLLVRNLMGFLNDLIVGREDASTVVESVTVPRREVERIREIAAAAGPDGAVLGIERDPVHIECARTLAQKQGADALEIREGDALDLPLSDDETGSFDLVYCRFVLEHLPNPLEAVKEMLSAAPEDCGLAFVLIQHLDPHPGVLQCQLVPDDVG